LKPVKEILYSPRFLREISFLLFFFAAFSALFGLVPLIAGGSEPDALLISIGSFVQAIIYSVLAIFIRRGSIIALWIAGALFVLDTILQLLQPTAALVARGLLIFVLISYIKRARAEA
jgi:hypothetical protein